MLTSFSFEKAWFSLSVVVLCFVYGYVSHAWGVFPHHFVERSWKEVHRLFLTEQDDTHEKVFDRSGARTYQPAKMQSGVTAITSWWQGPGGDRQFGIKVVDADGRVLHEWLFHRGDVFEGTPLQQHKLPDIQGSMLLPDGDVLVNVEYVGMARIGPCGTVRWTLDARNHHSIARGSDGSFWVPGASREPVEESERYPDGYPGLGEVWADRILHVSGDGEVLEEIDVLDVLYANDLDRLLFQHDQTEGDVTHLNDVEPLPPSLADEYPMFDAGDLLVSLRYVNVVFVFDPESQIVKWHATGPFVWQHDPDFLGDGWIGVFDNNRIRGEAQGMGSRILGFQPHTDSTRTLFRPEHVDRFYTQHRGKWQLLENGNMLLTEEEAGRALEVAPDGTPVWEWIHAPYGSRVPSVTKATRYSLTAEEVAAWSCP